MNAIAARFFHLQRQLFHQLGLMEGIAPLLLRLYLIPIFWMAGSRKIDFETLMPTESTVAYFGNAEWGLGMPLPTLMAFMAGWTEVLGAVLLAVGFAVRFIAVPLMVTMIVAAVTAHWDYGWQMIADPGAPFANERVMESAAKIAKAREILDQHGNYSWLTSSGSVVILNNGIQFASSLFIMLLSLFFTGGGRYTSVDYWLNRHMQKSQP